MKKLSSFTNVYFFPVNMNNANFVLPVTVTTKKLGLLSISDGNAVAQKNFVLATFKSLTSFFSSSSNLCLSLSRSLCVFLRVLSFCRICSVNMNNKNRFYTQFCSQFIFRSNRGLKYHKKRVNLSHQGGFKYHNREVKIWQHGGG